MNELLTKLIQAITDSGGKMTYPQFLETVDYRERQLLPRVIKMAKQQKKIKSYLVWDESTVTNTHYLEIYSEAAPAATANNNEAQS